MKVLEDVIFFGVNKRLMEGGERFRILEDFEPVELFKGGNVEMGESFEGFWLCITVFMKVG